MINADIGEFLGFEYHEVTDDGSMGEIVTPFRFKDEDAVPVYVETNGSAIRFFDDGAILRRLMGWGIPVEKDEDIAFLDALIRPCGAALNADGEVEVNVLRACAPAGFAAYMAAMLAIVQWEKNPAAVAQAQRCGEPSHDPIDA